MRDIDEASRYLDSLRNRIKPAIDVLYPYANYDRYWKLYYDVTVPRANCLARLDEKLEGIVWC